MGKFSDLLLVREKFCDFLLKEKFYDFKIDIITKMIKIVDASSHFI
jgi:hypothetical protein